MKKNERGRIMKLLVKNLAKMLVAIIAVTFLLCAFASCSLEYKGKDIVSIEKTSVDYMGGITSGQILYLNTGEIYSFYNNPYLPEESYENKLEFSYDPALSNEIVNEFYKIGIFNLRSRYEPLTPVMDGGGWTLTITYADGSTKISSGSNAGPYTKFEKAGKVFYDITGGDFISAPSGEYKYAPPISIGLQYFDERTNTTYVNGTSVSTYSCTWRGRDITAKDGELQQLEIINGFDYTLTVYLQSYYDQFTSARVYSYTDDPSRMQEVEITVKSDFELDGIKRSMTFAPERNKNYIVYLEFKLGNAEYRFSTYE